MNNVYLGIVSEVKEHKARVAVGDLTTDYLNVMQFANGYMQRFSPIRAGEQCVILAPHGDVNSGIILRGLFYSAHPAPSTDDSVETTVYEDGTEISYDSKSKILTVNAAGDIAITAAGNVTIKVDGNAEITASAATVKADSVLVDSASIDLGEGGLGVVTQECICSLTGNAHPMGSAIVRAATK